MYYPFLKHWILKEVRFDCISFITQVAYGLGIGHKETFLFLACLHLIMIGTSTFLILPKCYISSPIKNVEVQISVTDGMDYQLTETQPTEIEMPKTEKGK